MNKFDNKLLSELDSDLQTNLDSNLFIKKWGHSRAYFITFAIPRYNAGLRSFLVF